MQDRNGNESLSPSTFCKVFDPDRPPPDPHMNNNNNNGDETDHGDKIDQGGEGEEGLDEDIKSDDLPDNITSNVNDGTGLSSGTDSDSTGLGSGTDSSTSDNDSSANEADIDTDEVSTDESEHGDQDEQHVLEGATGGLPINTTAETNVVTGGNSHNVQDGVHSSSFDHNNPHSDKLQDRKFLSDTQILELLPPSQPTEGNATDLTKCNADGCRATGISDCQGYCTEHFCNLYRQGQLDIKPRFEDEIQPGMPNMLPHEERSARTRACLQPPNPHHGVMGSAQGQDHGLHKGRSSSQGHDERHRRTSKLKCKSSMCKYAARETGYCGKCSRQNQLGAEPKEKYRCLAKGCSNKSNSKYGLCSSCSSILEKDKAKKIQLPRPEIQGAKCTYPSSSSDENSRGNEQSITRRDRHTRRYQQYKSPPIEGSYSHNKVTGIGARRGSPALYSNEDQHIRQNSAKNSDEGRGSRYYEPPYESRAPPFNRNDKHYEMRRYDHTNEGRHTESAQQNSARPRHRGESAQYEQRHIRERRQRESQYEASPPPQPHRNNMHSEMRRYNHTHGGRHSAEGQLEYPYEESLEGYRDGHEQERRRQEEYSPHRNNVHRSNANSRYENTEQRDYAREYHRYQQPRPEPEDHDRRTYNRQLNTRHGFIPVHDRTPPESIVYSPESSYYGHEGSEMDQRPSQGLARHYIDRRNNYEDREVASRQRNTSDSDLESGTSSFAPTYSESGENPLRKCRRAGCDGYCKECRRQ